MTNRDAWGPGGSISAMSIGADQPTVCEGRQVENGEIYMKYIVGNCLHCLAAGKAGEHCKACKKDDHQMLQPGGMPIDPRKLAALFGRPTLINPWPRCDVIKYYYGDPPLSQEYERLEWDDERFKAFLGEMVSRNFEEYRQQEREIEQRINEERETRRIAEEGEAATRSSSEGE